MASGPTNSPAGPGMSTMGMKASTVVSVLASSGTAKWRSASRVATSAESPCRKRSRRALVITIALSTIRPSATMMPIILIWWISIPNGRNSANVSRAVAGMASPTVSAERHPMVRNRIPTTSTNPISRLSATSLNR